MIQYFVALAVRVLQFSVSVIDINSVSVCVFFKILSGLRDNMSICGDEVRVPESDCHDFWLQRKCLCEKCRIHCRTL